MKRLITLLLGAALLCGAVTSANAATIEAKGEWAFDFSWTDGMNYRSADDGGESEDDFAAHQRLRTQIDIIASESLRGVVFLEMGTTTWGQEDGALGSDGKSVKVRRSYIDWMVPETELKVRMGLQGMDLPGATFGASPILSDEDVAALVLSYAVNDNVGLTAFWARPYDNDSGNTADDNNDFDEVDVFGLTAPVTLDGVSVTPYLLYASVGKDVDGTDTESWEIFQDGMQSLGQSTGLLTGDDTTTHNAWWGGVAFELTMFDPFAVKMDFTYGNKDADEDYATREGWLVSGMVEYKMEMMTPGVFAWYGSGEDDDLDNGSERMPSISPNAWAPTSFGFPGSVFNQDSQFALNGAGLWGVGVQLADISFVENLSHVLRVAYMRGTNDSELVKDTSGLADALAPAGGGVFLTDEDSAWEVNFDHTYQIYENLTFILEMGYIRLDLDEDVWGANGEDLNAAKKLTFNLVYEF
ncbi:outer membrane homotrimeric porin [Nitratidesulfovibrio termitidis]|uniref:outer membrane homotrimeric porin n=1 Tax=Nitratidesulfovibrio termitidis TaxID=42252 RepID=UPI00041259DF|nr:outer membrane homotrimeric porin [Nitratidesulfovibrio termitidis]